MNRVARRLEAHAERVPSWCERALTLERIERVGTQGCFWLLFFDIQRRIVHAAGAMSGARHRMDQLAGRSIEELLPEDLLGERLELFDRIVRKPELPVLVIDMWQSREVWACCEAECDDEGRCGLLAIGYRPCVEQPIPDDIELCRLRRVTDAGSLADLSLGEIEILRLLSLGLSREEMSHRVHRTLKAVERRRTMLGRKLGATSTHDLTLIGLRAGLHRLSEPELERFWELNCDHHRHAAHPD